MHNGNSITGSKDTDLHVLTYLSVQDLNVLSQVCKFTRELCNNEDFWRNKFKKKYFSPDLFSHYNYKCIVSSDRTWKQRYLLMRYYSDNYHSDRAAVKAAENGHNDFCKFFLKFYMEISPYPTKHPVPDILRIAVKNNNEELIDFLLLEYSKCCKFSEGVFGAAAAGNVKLMEFFIEKSERNMEDDTWDRGLFGAVVGGRMDLVKYFIDKGANDKNVGIVAGQENNREIIDFLLKRNLTKPKYVIDGACVGGHKDLLDYMETKYGEIKDWKRSLYFACGGVHLSMVQYCIERLEKSGRSVGPDEFHEMIHVSSLTNKTMIDFLVGRGVRLLYLQYAKEAADRQGYKGVANHIQKHIDNKMYLPVVKVRHDYDIP